MEWWEEQDQRSERERLYRNELNRLAEVERLKTIQHYLQLGYSEEEIEKRLPNHQYGCIDRQRNARRVHNYSGKIHNDYYGYAWYGGRW